MHARCTATSAIGTSTTLVQLRLEVSRDALREREREIDACQSIVIALITYATLTPGELFLSTESKQYGHNSSTHVRLTRLSPPICVHRKTLCDGIIRCLIVNVYPMEYRVCMFVCRCYHDGSSDLNLIGHRCCSPAFEST